MYACLLFALVTSISGGNRDLVFHYGSSGADQPVTAAKADSLNLRRVGSWRKGAGLLSWKITVSGNYCYLGWGSAVSVLDISDPYNPFDVSRITVTSPFAPSDICVDDTMLYITDFAYLWIESVSDPTQPRQLGKYQPPGSGESPVGVVASGSVAYVATQSGGGADPRGLRILDVSDPSSISELAYLPMTHSTGRLCLRGDYLYLVDYIVMLHVIDVSDPSAPVDMGQVDLGGFMVNDVCVEGEYAYVAADDAGTQIVDISDSSSPDYVSFIWPTWRYTHSAHVVNSLAYIADDSTGVRVVNVVDPMSTVETGYYVHSSSVMDAHYSNGYIYAALSDSALLVLEYYGPQGIEENNSELAIGNRQLSVHPNPFIHNTVVEFGDVETPYMVSLQIHDLSGRFVRSVSIHDSRFTIDGLEAGIYFVKAHGYKPVKITKIR
jgi:hypothetical protein